MLAAGKGQKLESNVHLVVLQWCDGNGKEVPPFAVPSVKLFAAGRSHSLFSFLLQ